MHGGGGQGWESASELSLLAYGRLGVRGLGGWRGGEMQSPCPSTWGRALLPTHWHQAGMCIQGAKASTFPQEAKYLAF